MLLFQLTIVVVATEMAACSYDPYCLHLCQWTDCPGVLQLEDTPRPTYPLVSASPPHSLPATASSISHSSLSIQPESTRLKFATEEELSTFAKGLVLETKYYMAYLISDCITTLTASFSFIDSYVPYM